MTTAERLAAIEARTDHNASRCSDDFGHDCQALLVAESGYLQTAADDISDLVRALETALEALKDYSSLNGDAIIWPNRDACTYLEDPAKRALAKIDEIMRGQE